MSNNNQTHENKITHNVKTYHSSQGELPVDKSHNNVIYYQHGLTTCIHGNTKRFPHNVTSYEAIQKIVTIVTNFAEEQAILLPGRIPGYKKDFLSYCHQVQLRRYNVQN